MCQYGRDGSHLAQIIKGHLRKGWCLYYRAYCADSEKKAGRDAERVAGAAPIRLERDVKRRRVTFLKRHIMMPIQQNT
jgi:hypothetical protein